MRYSMKDSIVSFIDILGSSDAIKYDAEESLNVVHIAYENALKEFDELFDDKKFYPDVKIFSDNIVIAVSYSNPHYMRSAFLAVSMMSAMLQVEFLKHGWLTRGGITSGSFFADKIMVWGTALVKTYEIKSKIAVYPRIVIDPILIGELNLAIHGSKSPCNRWIRQDKDGLFYIEYLSSCLKNVEIFLIKLLELVETKISEKHDNTRICQKWLWLSNYVKERLSELEKQGGQYNESKDERQRD